MSVDAVITWVDAHDQKTSFQLQSVSSRYGQFIDASRFFSNGELEWCVRTIRCFMPWVDNIFIVTNGQDPRLDPDLMVRVVDHEHIFDESVQRPCFNSEVIEWHCHKIDGLSEEFIMFNDDMIVGRELSQEDVAGPHKLGLFWFDQSPIDVDVEPTSLRQQATLFLKALLDSFYGAGKRYYPAHIPRLYKKSILRELISDRQTWISLLNKSPLRNSISVPLHVLYVYSAISFVFGTTDLDLLLTQQKQFVQVPPWKRYVFVPLGATNETKWLDQVRASRPMFFCLNDHIGQDRVTAANTLGRFMEEYMTNCAKGINA